MNLASLESPKTPAVPEQPKRREPSSSRPPVESVEQKRKAETEADTKIVSLRKGLEQEPSALQREVMRQVHPNLIATLDQEYLTQEMKRLGQEMEQDPAFAELFREVYLNDNREALQEKTQQQIRQLERFYFGEWAWLHPIELLRKRKKLETFRVFVQSMRPVRGDRNAGLTTFLSPRRLGVSVSFGVPDVIVQADKFVYGSFDRIRHYMTGTRSAALLDEQNAQLRGQIVMQDIANMGTAGMGNVATKYRDYLDNTFDYNGGKEVLSLYLASVFNTPEEAESFLAHNNAPNQVQYWQKEDILYAQDQKRLSPIVTAMKQLRDVTNLQPPMSLEIRIPDEAKKVGQA